MNELPPLLNFSLEEVYNLYAVLGEYLSLHRAILAQHEAKAAASTDLY